MFFRAFINSVSFIGYGRQQRTVRIKKKSTYMTIGLRSDNQLKEVVITATESKDSFLPLK